MYIRKSFPCWDILESIDEMTQLPIDWNLDVDGIGIEEGIFVF